MIRRVKPYFYLFAIACLWVQGCSKSGGNTTVTPPTPGKATLVAPAQNAVCTTGNILSTTQSAVTLNWQASANADSYTIAIKNLLTSTISQQTATTNTITVTLSRGTPYSWSVTATNSAGATQSDVWKFYNSGLGITSYAPFPADLTAPGFGGAITATGGVVTLTWAGSDADNDIFNYDVYFGTNANPTIYQSAVTAQSLSGVSVTSGVTYYWKILTRDSQGNTSTSDTYQFTVK